MCLFCANPSSCEVIVLLDWSLPQGGGCGCSSLRPGFWTRFQSFFSNLTIFYLDDSVVVADMWAESYVGNWFESLVDLVETRLMRLSRVLVWELLSWLLMTRLTP